MRALRISLLGVLACLLPQPATRASISDERSFPVRFEDGMVWVDVQAETRSGESTTGPLRFLVDTGASVSVLDRRAARRLGLPLGRKTAVAGVGTVVTGHGPIPWHASLGDVALPPTILVLDLERLGDACDEPVDGLLGADFFRERIVELDYRSGTLTLLDNSPAVPDERSLPLSVSSRGFSVRARVNGGRDQPLRVDTGCASALQWVNPSATGRECPGPPSVGLARVSIPQTLSGIQLGSHSFDTIATGLHRKPIFPGEAGLLGNGLLAMFGVITFDTVSGFLHLGANPQMDPQPIEPE
ncbi:MAG: retropepsin-like aspartic protease [Limisphaerales bacterium]